LRPDSVMLVCQRGCGLFSGSGAGEAFGSAAHQVYAVDQRGFGATSRGGPYGFWPMRDDVLGLLDVLGVPRCDLVGHSMGGTVAGLAAQQQPDRVAHLVTEDSPPPCHGRFRSSVTIGQPLDVPFDWAAAEAYVRDPDSPDPQLVGPDRRGHRPHVAAGRRRVQPGAAGPVR
jgi:pimeloyl-ACP methyl ester carboxylesterase